MAAPPWRPARCPGDEHPQSAVERTSRNKRQRETRARAVGWGRRTKPLTSPVPYTEGQEFDSWGRNDDHEFGDAEEVSNPYAAGKATSLRGMCRPARQPTRPASKDTTDHSRDVAASVSWDLLGTVPACMQACNGPAVRVFRCLCSPQKETVQPA